MAQFNNEPGLQPVRDLSAYIVDTPRSSTTALDFSASAVNTPTAARNVDLRHALAIDEALTVVAASVSGSGAGRDLPRQPELLVARYAARTATLDFTLRQGASSTTFTRRIARRGVVSGTTTPPPPAGGSDGGGGALGVGWPTARGAAIASLSRRRCG